MRVLLSLLLWLAPPFLVSAQSSLRKLDRSTLFGHEYVRLSDWAAANKFELRWLRPDEELQLKSTAGRLTFTVDSRKAQINGVSVWLSVNIARHNGGVFISPLDLVTVIHPVLFPPKYPPDEKIRTICLDPGHGGKDPGNQAGPSQEKRITLLFAKELQKELKGAGFKVILTRTQDAFVELGERPFSANRRQADLFLSLHFNAAEGSGAKGVETYCLTPAHASSTNARGEGATTGSYPANKLNDKNMALAYQVQKALVRNVPVEDRGVRRARFAVLKSPEMPAILIESGFMTDAAEFKRLLNPAHRKKLAQAIVAGVQAYKQIVER